MNNTQCSGLEFQNGNMTFDVCYSLISQSSDRISIKGFIRQKLSSNETYAFFQFYKENNKINDSDWNLDNSNCNKENVPYYCISNVWNFRWSDQPKYNLKTKGEIIFNTLLAEVEKTSSEESKDWKYKIILGFSWGMKSDNGTKIEKIPIQDINKNELILLIDLLRSKYPKITFGNVDNLINGKNANISGMW
ncbi:MAG: hypothetical protein M1496_05530 [Candidatus Thermoplasmatota archaeon]|jgi:hypothetical protein|nr:hypothetical protein [Candidatus Thermoplasmatota archaeon]